MIPFFILFVYDFRLFYEILIQLIIMTNEIPCFTIYLPFHPLFLLLIILIFNNGGSILCRKTVKVVFFLIPLCLKSSHCCFVLIKVNRALIITVGWGRFIISVRT